MAWKIEYLDLARRQLRKLDRQAAKEIVDYLDHRIAPLDDPRVFGKALTGTLRGTWRYRVRDYRLLCHVEDSRVTVLVIEIGHRRDVYD